MGSMAEDNREAFAQAVWQVVSMIPEGRVASYGQIAALCEQPRQARRVGRVLSQLPDGSRLPWHRVISASGHITSPHADEQARRLLAEGVQVRGLRVPIRRFLWRP